jgi:hypothetical protein
LQKTQNRKLKTVLTIAAIYQRKTFAVKGNSVSGVSGYDSFKIHRQTTKSAKVPQKKL